MKHHHEQARHLVDRGKSAWERDDFEGALQTFLKVLAEYPYFADVHNKAGLCKAMLGRPEAALVHFDAALERNSAYAEAHLNRGIVLQELGRHEEAQAAFDTATELDHRDSKAFPSDVGNRLAVTLAQVGDLYLVADHPAEAAEQYRKAIEIRPRFVDIRTKYAEALIELGREDEARVELEVTIELRPSFVGARIRLGVILRRQGDTEGAIREWQQCAAEDPEDMRPRAYLASVGVSFPQLHGHESAGQAEKEAG
jgi:tetratricopeptide (TPR) repeat protein